MFRTIEFVIAALCLSLFPVLAWGAGAIAIPGPGQGYQITKSDSSQPAPSGYEGRTDTSTETAVGNTPATTGKRIVANFTLGNQIRTCPLPDGTAEGTGVFSLTVDYSDAQANGTSTAHIQMRAEAKYKGQVGDDALLHGVVNADIDYTYSQTGTFRDKGGAIATTPPSNIQQHITIPITVAGNGRPPDFGAFSGGDPTKGHYAEAFGVGTALTYWAGVYYSVAQTKWYGGEISGGGTSIRGGQCAQIAFDPPSYTLQPPVGTQVKVRALVKAKSGESVKGNFLEAVAFRNSGSVTPGGGASDAGRPIEFTYTVAGKQVKPAGFSVGATSRAGTATSEWLTGLGTDWSGEITYLLNEHDEQPETEMGGSSTRESMQFTLTIKDGVGTATSHAELESSSLGRQKALRGGAITLIKILSDNVTGSADGSSPAHLQVKIDQSNGTYSILPDWAPATGKRHQVTCQRDSCQTYDQPYYATPTLYTGIDGKLSDPNHLSGSKTDQTRIGPRGTGERTWTVTWNLARQGSK